MEGSEGVGEPEEADTLRVTVWSVESSDLSSSSIEEKEVSSKGLVLDVASLGVSQPWCGQSDAGGCCLLNAW